ncbi:MAG: U32 family peptidase, partial [Firmicutes bacterium]|nr:U32 family peptidase [Bacillota bacterium]
HGRGTKVYVTLNTLVMDEELPALRKEIAAVAEAGVDAVLVQDLAVAKLLKEEYPDLPRHASTQMAVHNLEGVRMLEEMGFTRAVLARELSLDEIRKITEECAIEIEVFVQGAHCMSLSGGCYLSSMIGGRSGNRGLCAQPCRLEFQVKDRANGLSLKDMCYLPHLTALREAGVASLKIEGRMKRPEYVAAAVTAYKKALDGLEWKGDREKLQAVFSRSGFTDGFLTAKRNGTMFGVRRKEDVTAAAGVLKELEGLYRSERQSIPVDMIFSALEGSPVSLTATDGEYWATAFGEQPQQARSRELTAEDAARSLEKTGGTPFYLRDLSGEIGSGLMVPAAELNRLRRQVLEDLLQQRGKVEPWKQAAEGSAASKSEGGAGGAAGSAVGRAFPEEPALRLRFEKAGQIPTGLKPESASERAEGGAVTELVLPLSEIQQNPQLIELWGEGLIGEIPALHFPAQADRLLGQLQSLRDKGLKKVLCEDLGALELARKLGLAACGGHGLNILNSLSLEEYRKLGLADATISFELSMARIRRLTGGLRRGILAYGYLPLMKMRSCPARGQSGCGDCKGRTPVRDRKGETFTLLCRGKQYSELLNCVPLYIGDKNYGGVDFLTLYFTTESREECSRILKLFRKKGEPDFPRTNGLYYRELL